MRVLALATLVCAVACSGSKLDRETAHEVVAEHLAEMRLRQYRPTSVPQEARNEIPRITRAIASVSVMVTGVSQEDETHAVVEYDVADLRGEYDSTYRIALRRYDDGWRVDGEPQDVPSHSAESSTVNPAPPELDPATALAAIKSSGSVSAYLREVWSGTDRTHRIWPGDRCEYESGLQNVSVHQLERAGLITLQPGTCSCGSTQYGKLYPRKLLFTTNAESAGLPKSDIDRLNAIRDCEYGSASGKYVDVPTSGEAQVAKVVSVAPFGRGATADFVWRVEKIPPFGSVVADMPSDSVARAFLLRDADGWLVIHVERPIVH